MICPRCGREIEITLYKMIGVFKDVSYKCACGTTILKIKPESLKEDRWLEIEAAKDCWLEHKVFTP